jgi:uncharacterized protein YutE (UPF0331/DUF86 family)
METLGYSTSIISWQFIWSAIEMIRNSKSKIYPIDFNMQATPCIVMVCISLESFSNEMSSLTHAFLYNLKTDFDIENLSKKRKCIIGIDLNICKNITKIRESKDESFYERYKKLLSELRIDKPKFLQDISYLCNLRNSIVHFRSCDISVIQDKDGIIKYYQDPPEVFKYLKTFKVKKWPVIATDVDKNSAWNLRISTNAMAIWSIKLIIEAIIYVLDNLPHGDYKDFILKYYKYDKNSNVFEKGKYNIQELENKIFKNS